MALSIPKEEIRSLVATLSGIPASRVYWDGEPERPMLGPVSGKAGKITLNVPARAELGTIEPRYEYDGVTGEQSEEWGAHETLTISIRADNFLGHGEAFDTLEKVRFRIARPTYRTQLRAADLAYIDSPSIVSLDYAVDNRAISAASLDVRLAHMRSEAVSDATTSGEESAEWIEHAEITGNIPPA